MCNPVTLRERVRVCGCHHGAASERVHQPWKVFSCPFAVGLLCHGQPQATAHLLRKLYPWTSTSLVFCTWLPLPSTFLRK